MGRALSLAEKPTRRWIFVSLCIMYFFLQADLHKKDPRLPPSGLDKVEKPPGNWPDASAEGHAGFPETSKAPPPRAAGDSDHARVANESGPGPEDSEPRADPSPTPGTISDPSTERVPGAYGER